MVADVGEAEEHLASLRVPTSGEEGRCCEHDLQTGATQSAGTEACDSSVEEASNCRLVEKAKMSGSGDEDGHSVVDTSECRGSN